MRLQEQIYPWPREFCRRPWVTLGLIHTSPNIRNVVVSIAVASDE